MLNTLLTAVPKPDPVLFVRIRLKRPDRNLYYVTAAVPKILYWGSWAHRCDIPLFETQILHLQPFVRFLFLKKQTFSSL